MSSKVRMSGPTIKLLRLLLDKPQEAVSGAAISKATGIGSGTMYPLLQRLEMASWIKGEWEDVDPSEIGRPKRRLYKLTGLGQNEARRELADLGIGVAKGDLVWNS